MTESEAQGSLVMADRMTTPKDHSCILMFSGGRDSTLAAIRLVRSGIPLILVTATSKHLTGADIVQQRLAELKGVLPADTRWMTIQQPEDLHTDTSFYERTCLPCHHAYIVIAATVALSFNCRRLAFGYVKYQSHWPEQTPLAVDRIRRVLSELGIDLLLPVYDVGSRDEVDAQLSLVGLSTLSLEQKCTRQVRNVTLPDDILRAQIDLWEHAIRESAASLHLIETAVVESGTLNDVTT